VQPPVNENIILNGSPSVRYGTYTGAPALVGVSNQPFYFIEVLCYYNLDESLTTGSAVNYCNYYRITARGYGGNPNSQVTLQEVFLKTP
jgi:Tfp pilus assembly protein PilX